MRWLWKIESNDHSLWTLTVMGSYENQATTVSSSSFFLEELKLLQPVRASRLCYTNHPLVQPPIYGILWAAEIPERIRVFLWLLIRNRLPTATDLAAKQLPHTTCCVLYGASIMEDAGHLFIQCSNAATIWHSTTYQPDLQST